MQAKKPENVAFFKKSQEKDAFFLCLANLEAICTKLKLTFSLMPPKTSEK